MKKTIKATLALLLLFTTFFTYQAVAETNLLVNNDFESYTGTNGVADGWSSLETAGATGNYEVVNTPVFSGTKAQKISGSNIPFDSTKNVGGVVSVRQVVSVQENQPYVLEGQFNIEALSNAKVQIYVDFYSKENGDYSGFLTYGVSEYNQTTNGYVSIQKTGTTPAGAKSARLYAILRSTTDNGSGTFYVDSMKFTAESADTTAPDAPVVNSVDDNDTVVTGTAEPNSTVKVKHAGTELGSAAADANGMFTVTIPVQAIGTVLDVTATDQAANESLPTQVTVIDGTAPNAPIIVSPTGPVLTNDNTLDIIVRAEQGSMINVYDGITVVGTGTGNDINNVTITLSTLSDGVHNLKVTATDAGNNVSPEAVVPAITIDTIAPAAPIIVSPTAPIATNDNTPNVIVRAEQGATIKILEGTTLVGTGIGNGVNNVTITISTLVEGTHNLKATATDAANNVSPAATIPSITIDTVAPIAPVIKYAYYYKDAIQLEIEAPDDNANINRAARYEIRYSTSPITEANWNNASILANSIVPGSPGTLQKTLGYVPTTSNYYYARVKAFDVAGNSSLLSNEVSKSLMPGPDIVPVIPTGYGYYGDVKISDDGYSGSLYHPANAFDDNITTSKWYATGKVTGGHWIKVDLGLYAQIVNKITITPFMVSGTTSSVNNFRFYGSNDDMNYSELLYSQWSPYKNSVKQAFGFNNSTSYRYYKLVILDSWTTSPNANGLVDMELLRE